MGRKCLFVLRSAFCVLQHAARDAAVLTVFALLATLTITGCYRPVRYPVIVDGPPEPTLVRVVARYQIVGESVQQRPLMSLALGQGQDVTFILATIHGDEPAGTTLVRRLAIHLRQNPEILNGRKVVLLRLANPDGLVHNSRYNAHGVDLNRNFDAANRANSRQFGLMALSEPESGAIQQIILQHKPDRIVSVHQRAPGRPGCIDYDGPAADLARHMADHCDLPVTRLGSMPGSLGSYAGITLGIPIITFEMNQADTQLDSETLWRKYGKALLAAITYPESAQ